MRKRSMLHRAKCCRCGKREEGTKMTVRRVDPYLTELAHMYCGEEGMTKEEFQRALPQENWCLKCYYQACMEI